MTYRGEKKVKTNCPIFCYHGVKENPRPWGVSVDEFERQVKWLSENHQILTASQAYNKVREGGLPENAAVLTFDDRLKSSYEASKILDKYDVKGTYYTISELGGKVYTN
jgi:peptidoglycan/xylan/chitin deacetylase (PgdA/CDA1 family)